MADSAAFEWACGELERRSELDRLEARGTVRLALRSGGLEARTVTAEQLAVVFEKLLPRELDVRGVPDGDALSTSIAAGLRDAPLAASADGHSPEDVFRRIGGR